MDYIRICKDLADFGKLIAIKNNDFSGVYKSINKEKDHYYSIYYFNDDHKSKFDQTGSVAGIKDVTTDKLIFDFDSDKEDLSKEENIDLARQDAISLVNRLQKEGYTEQNIRVFFSGGKGFEVSLILDNQRVTPAEAKNICLNLAEGLNTIDRKVYNATRIFRLPLTKHPSGLYKSPLTVSDLESMTTLEILDNAKSNLEYTDIKDAWKPVKLTRKLTELKEKAPKVSVEKAVLSLDITSVDWTLKPKFLTPEKYLISLGFFDNGNRSHALMILASTLKNQGFNDTQAYHFLKAAAEMQSERTGTDKFPKAEIYNNVISQVYGPNWMGGMYSVQNDDLLQQLNALIPESIKAQNIKDVVSIREGFGAFAQYANEIDKNTLKFGIPQLDDNLHVQVGRLYAVLGAPGSGKTSTAITMLNNTSKQGEHSIFFSYDMSQYDVYQKLIQKHHRLGREKLFNVFRENDAKKQQQFIDTLDENYKNTTFVFKTGQTIEDIKNTIIEREKALGVNIRLVVVDYLELIQSRFSDPTQASMESIQGLREIAISLNKAVIVLLQPNKASSNIDEPITSYNASKGSSSIAQAVTAMLTVHRPGCSSRTPENDNYFSIDCVKNRSGALFSVDLHWDGLTGSIRGLEPIEAQQLEELREAKRQARNNEDGLF